MQFTPSSGSKSCIHRGIGSPSSRFSSAVASPARAFTLGTVFRGRLTNRELDVLDELELELLDACGFNFKIAFAFAFALTPSVSVFRPAHSPICISRSGSMLKAPKVLWREPGQKRLQHPGGLVITLLACLVVRGLGRKRWEGGGSAVGALALVFLDIRNRHT